MVSTSSTRPVVGSTTRAARLSFPAGGVEDEVVVVATTEADLLVVGIDARTDGHGLGEVEGRSRHGPNLARRDERVVYGGRLGSPESGSRARGCRRCPSG